MSTARVNWFGGGAGVIDVLAESIDEPGNVLVGEVKLRVTAGEAKARLDALRIKAGGCPALTGKRCIFAIWVLEDPPDVRGVVGPEGVVLVE